MEHIGSFHGAALEMADPFVLFFFQCLELCHAALLNKREPRKCRVDMCPGGDKYHACE